MNTYHVIEILVVGGAVGFSLWNLAKRFVPQLRGANASGKAGGCSSCDSCGACSTPPPSAGKKPDEQPVHFHRN